MVSKNGKVIIDVDLFIFVVSDLYELIEFISKNREELTDDDINSMIEGVLNKYFDVKRLKGVK